MSRSGKKSRDGWLVGFGRALDLGTISCRSLWPEAIYQELTGQDDVLRQS